MTQPVRCLASALLGLAACSVLVPIDTAAQMPKRGEIRIAPVATGEERTSQDKLWVLDVYFKPMRMIPVELTDVKTGEKKLEFIWYIAYRAMHRKTAERANEQAPRNEVDPPVSPPLFIPEATLIVTDNDRQDVYQDTVIPEALAAINQRERANYKSAVSIVGPLPAPAETGAGDDNALWGVLMWRGIDPEADRYTVYLTGFSNGIRKLNGPDDMPIIQTKTIMQKYWRKGDRFDPKELEISLDGDPKWIYR